ncbi:magnesium chelatase subunit D [Methylobacterium bullatum]|uniref:Magnesium-chelatase 60 kDa subunit n=1 Tax=Methylobacterium bullatum TaxID=570505 RepID=A0A679KHB9_9HYPH|nr:Magnesium-chelatase 60 kDa subunit [Methylobacterium bullatum]
MSEGLAIWADALLVARLVAADPHGCGGVVLRAGAGPVRDRWLEILRENLNPGKPLRRMPAGIAEDRLVGGLDLAATLAAGRPVAQAGLLAEADGGLLVAAMAERMGQGTAAHLAAALDTGRLRVERDGLAETRPAKVGLVLLDEGIGEDEAAPAALADRLAFHLDLTSVPPSAMRPVLRPPCDGLSPESETPPHGGGRSGHDPVAELSEVAARLGIDSLRAPLLALRVARLLARLDGRAEIAEADAREAARLVLGHRATRLPEQESAPEEEEREQGEPSPSEQREPGPDPQEGTASTPDDRIVEAARAAIPAGLLALLLRDGPRLRMPRAGKAGAKAASARSGRPMGARPGDPQRGRLDLIATLRAAAPWQGIRRRAEGGGTCLMIRPDDIRITRFRQRTETTTIFTVDASGSSALERLAEAKGAVELLLAEAYTRRDKVALVAFRGAGAELVLAPDALPGAGAASRPCPEAAGRRSPPASTPPERWPRGPARRRDAGGGDAHRTEGQRRPVRDRRGGSGRARIRPKPPAFSARRMSAPSHRHGPEAAGFGALPAAAMGRYLPLPHADAGAMSAAIRSARE